MAILENLKKNEDDGFKSGGNVYKDHLGYDTIGYGTLLPLSEKECETLLRMRLDEVIKETNRKLDFLNIKSGAWNIIYEMAYQLGVPKLLRFKNMIKALKEQDYLKASEEMVDSLWYRQTPNRAKKLVERMKAIKD